MIKSRAAGTVAMDFFHVPIPQQRLKKGRCCAAAAAVRFGSGSSLVARGVTAEIPTGRPNCLVHL